VQIWTVGGARGIELET